MQNEMMQYIKESLISDFETTSIDNGDDYTIKKEKATFTVTSTKNQERQINDNVTTIDLGKCASKLIEEYNISSNESLYIFMVDILIDNIHKIEYEVYYNFTFDNLTILDLNFCKGIKIDISFPIYIPNNEIDKYNKSSGYYNDICYTLTSDNGTDKSLKDRKNEYKIYNLSVCEEDCEFTSYNKDFKKAVCSCFTKKDMTLISKIILDKKKLFSNFKDIRNIGNFKMLSCMHLFFAFNNIFKNSSNYMFVILFTLNVISILTFLFYDKRKIEKLIKEQTKEKITIETQNNEKNQIINFNINQNNKKIRKKDKRKIKSGQRQKTKSNLVRKLYEGKQKTKTKEVLKKKYNDYELNNLEYEDALKNDKRSFSQLYISLIKSKHLLIFSFFKFDDYNSQIIKINIFFYTFCMNLVVSAMFYSDSTMHKIYIDEGSFDFTYQLPQMVYSFIISTILENLINLLGLYENDIV